MPALIESEKIRVGILGCSDIARRKFIPALITSTGACLAGIGSSHPGKNKLFADELSTPFMSYQELISDPAVDLIYLSLPNHLHEVWAIAALEQGKHVICEKPLGLSPSSVRLMHGAAATHRRLLFENIMYLHHPQHRMVKEIVSSGRIGGIISLRSEFAFPGPPEGDFRLDPDRGGGAFNDMNRYPLSASLFFLTGKKHRFIKGTKEEECGLTISLEAESVTDAGEQFSFLTAFGKPYRSFYEITGREGSIRVERAYTTPPETENRIIVTVDGRDESCAAPAGDHFAATIDHVCSLLRSGNWQKEAIQAEQLADLAQMFSEKSVRRQP